MTELKPNEFRCGCCGKVYQKGWSDEEAKAEAAENFPDFSVDECDLVCDDCFNKHFGPLVEEIKNEQQRTSRNASS